MKILKQTAVAAIASAALFVAPVAADSPGQLAGGANVLKVKNVTQNTAYSNAVTSVKCGDTVKYSITLSNTEFGALNNIMIAATLGNTTKVTATPDSGASAGTSGTATVALASNQKLVYDNGSTKLYDANSNLISTLSDGIATGGVNKGTLNGSTLQFVNFTAHVDCPTTTTEQPKTPATPAAAQPTTLPETGPEAGLAAMAGTGILGYAAMAYRRSKRALAAKLLNR